MSVQTGKVYFIGLGPSVTGFVPERALSLIRDCGMVVLGPEVEKGWPDLLPGTAERFFTGRRGDVLPPSAEQVADAMRRACSQGKNVVRLFPGDPLFTAEGDAELLLCRNYGIRFEVVPGIPTSTVASIYAGIPLLHGTLANTALFVHTPGLMAREGLSRPPEIRTNGGLSPESRRPGVKIRRGASAQPTREVRIGSVPRLVPLPPDEPPPPSDAIAGPGKVDWKNLGAAADVLVFLNVGLFMDRLVPGLESCGRSKSEPLALILDPGSPRQRTIAATIGSLKQEIARQHIPEDAMVIVGDTVNLRDLLDFQSQRRLLGMKVALLDAPEILEAETKAVEAVGGTARHFVLARTLPQTALADLLEGIGDDLRSAHYIIFGDDSSAELFLEGLHGAGLDVRIIPEHCQLIALGVPTATRLRTSGLQVQLVDVASEGEGALLMKLPKSMLERRTLFIESTDGKRELQRELRVRGAVVTSVPVYERVVLDDEVDRLEADLKAWGIDLLLVHSEEAAHHLLECWGLAKLQKLVDGILLASCCADATAFLEGAGLRLTTSASSLSRLISRLELEAIPTRGPTPTPPPVGMVSPVPRLAPSEESE
ncbi:hypothetical protein GC173_18685, partial [bacterium]|nr:hypothetical protein [bacterium]